MTDAALPRAQAIDDTERAPPRRPPPASGGPLRAWIVAALVAAATWASLALSRVEGGVASVWIANGLVVAACLVADRRQWPRLLGFAAAAMVAVRLAHGDGWPATFALTTVNLVEILTIVFTVRGRVQDVGAAEVLRPLATAATACSCASLARTRASLAASSRIIRRRSESPTASGYDSRQPTPTNSCSSSARLPTSLSGIIANEPRSNAAPMPPEIASTIEPETTPVNPCR